MKIAYRCKGCDRYFESRPKPSFSVVIDGREIAADLKLTDDLCLPCLKRVLTQIADGLPA